MYPEDILDKVQEIEKHANSIKQENNKEQKYIKIKQMKNKMYDFLLKVSIIEGESETKVVNEVIELLQMLDNKHGFDEIFKSDINYSLFFLYVKAVIYQKNWDLKNLSDILSKMEGIYEKELNINNPLFFVKENEEFPQFKKYFGFEQFRKIKYFTVYIETLLQHTAVLSQLNDHKGALKKGNYCLKVYQKLFLSLNKIFELIVAVGHENLNNVDFDDDNLYIFLKYLELIKKFNFPNEEKNKTWDSDCTYWKINKNNNDKYLIKKIENQSLIEFPKEKINIEWSFSFHISNIVKLVNFETFHLKLTNITLDKNLLVKIFLMFSCCIFSIATENRFISHEEVSEELKTNKNLEKKQNSKNHQKYLQEVSKELKLQKHQRFVYSEKVHSKALEILLFGFSNNIKLLKHFLQSYKKNYTFNILAIQEVDEPSVSTMKKSEYFNDLCLKIPDKNEIMDINRKLNKIVDGRRDLKTLRYHRSGVSINKILTSKSPFRKNSNIFNRLKINKKDLSPKFYKKLSQKLLTKTSFKKKKSSSIKKSHKRNSLHKKEVLLRKSKNEFNEILKTKNIKRNNCKSKEKTFKKFKKSLSRSNNKKHSKKNFSSKLENLINQMNDRIQNFNNDIPNNLE